MEIEFDANGTTTPTKIAEALGCDPKQLRAHMRSIAENRAGKGGAWKLDIESAQTIADSWNRKRSIQSTAIVFKQDTSETIEAAADEAKPKSRRRS